MGTAPEAHHRPVNALGCGSEGRALEHRPQIQLDLKYGNGISQSDISRFELHRQNLADLFAKSPMVSLQRCKIYLVGWGGSGKTTLRRALKRTRGNVPLIGNLLAYAPRHAKDRQCDPDRETVGVEVNCLNSSLLFNLGLTLPQNR